jgi:hypothetical protein
MRSKAYIVSCPDDDHGCEVVFAPDASKARQWRGGDTCDHSYIELRARRAPDLDRHAPGPVSMVTLIREHGWYGLCHNCEKQVYDYSEGWVADDDGGRVFCSEGCREKLRKSLAETKARRDAIAATEAKQG